MIGQLLLLTFIAVVLAEDRLIAGLLCGPFGKTRCGANQSCIQNACVDIDDDGCATGACCGPKNAKCFTNCVDDQCLSLTPPSPSPVSSKLPCGCASPTTQCKSGESCVNNVCTYIALNLPTGIADGTPLCHRLSTAGCCGKTFSACLDGQVCDNDQCVDVTQCKRPCGCNSFQKGQDAPKDLTCAFGESCVNSFCTKNTLPKIPEGLADGTPGCLRSGGLCCGEKWGTCGDGQVCEKNVCVDAKQCYVEPKKCGCNAAPNGVAPDNLTCDFGQSCIQGICTERDVPAPPPGAADGTPGCLRIGSLCCGENWGFCKDGQVCESNECVDAETCVEPPSPPQPCGCNAVQNGVAPNKIRCEFGESCIKGFCTKQKVPTPPPGAADGTPGCLRSGSLCCGENWGFCQDGQVCENSSCVEAKTCSVPAKPRGCGCDNRSGDALDQCGDNQMCESGQCKDIDYTQYQADGAPTCIRGAEPNTFCCNGKSCAEGNTCTANGECLSHCPQIADGNLLPPDLLPKYCGCGIGSTDAKAKCGTNQMCQDNECVDIDFSKYASDGAPACIRAADASSFCCDGKSCKNGSVCSNGECLEQCPLILDGSKPPVPQGAKYCGCGSVIGKNDAADKCGDNQMCEKGQCVDIDFSKYASDGAPACIRSGSIGTFCCNGKSCQLDNVCTASGECLEQCPLLLDGRVPPTELSATTARSDNPPTTMTLPAEDADALCGCATDGTATKACTKNQMCNDDQCEDIGSQFAADGAPLCVRNGEPNSFCCGGASCQYGNVCAANECLEECPILADGSSSSASVTLLSGAAVLLAAAIVA